MSKQFTLGKNERLKSRKLIEQLFSEGNKFVTGPFRTFYKADKEKKFSLQFGVGVSSRNFKKAVDRNRIKMMIKEAYRLQKNNLKENSKEQNMQLNVFVIYTGKEIPVYQDVSLQIEKVLNKLNLLISEKK